MNTHYDGREELERWAKIIEKAQAEGKFNDAPKPPVPSQQTSVNSFFGLQNTHPTSQPASADGEYWKKLSEKSANPYQMLNEQNKDVAKVAKAILQTPNPIRQHTAGMDQALEPGPLGLTFSEKDIEDLAALKLQLYALECELNTFEGKGQNASKFEKQIKTVKEKVNELSTAMTQSFPYSLSPQGD
jgi:hypothetical protein